MMKCPRCVQKIHRGADVCPHCGFSMDDVDQRFGGEDLRLRCLTDRAGLLRTDDRKRVELAMARISKRFPQVFAAVYTGPLGGGGHLRQFGFWLLNRAAFEDVPMDKPNEAGVLLTIDPESKAAGMVFGYFLEPFLEEEDTFDCLSRAHAYWLEGRYADGIVRVLRHLEEVLAKRSRQARWDPGYFQRKVLPPAMRGDKVQRIRVGHRNHAAVEKKAEVEE